MGLPMTSSLAVEAYDIVKDFRLAECLCDSSCPAVAEAQNIDRHWGPPRWGSGLDAVDKKLVGAAGHSPPFLPISAVGTMFANEGEYN